ncbi:MAG: hypothetical protein NTY88_12455 [Bacteroidetes bacterium]|nr:hypothetical protein [Bacteroidota bacterium]
MKLEKKLESVLEKAKKIKEQYHKLQSKNETLEKELREVKQLLHTEQRQTVELRDTIKIIKLAQNIGSANASETDVTELKRKLNEYIKEIDLCITMLND